MAYVPNTASLRCKPGTTEQCIAVAAEGTAFGAVLARYERISNVDDAYNQMLAQLDKYYDEECYANIDVEDIFMDSAIAAFD